MCEILDGSNYGICLSLVEVARRLNKEWYDVLTIFLCSLQGRKQGRTAWSIRRYPQATEVLKKRKKERTSMVDRFQIQEGVSQSEH